MKRKERRPKQGGERDAVIAIGERAQAQQEPTVERIAQEQGPAARRVGHLVARKGLEQQRQVGRGDREHADVAVADRPSLLGDRIDDPGLTHAHQPS
ncbi:MAG: hypothetical protein ABIY55_28715, partial [Kofleriaceae bacterium]